MAKLNKFEVTEDEIDCMIEIFNKSDKYHEESQFLTRSWIKSVMSQPSKKHTKERRSFEYSQRKIENYLRWRKDSNATQLINTCLRDTERKYFPDYLGSGYCYWNGTDKEGSPILWVRPEYFPWNKFDQQRSIDFGCVILQGFLDALPSNVSNVNIVLLLDKCPYSPVVKHPKMVPSLLKLWLRCAPDRLKHALVVTSPVGQLFLKVTKIFAPSSVIDKITIVNSREEVAIVMLEQGLLETEKDIPDFLGGSFIHHSKEKHVRSFPLMMEKFKSQWPIVRTQ